MNFSPRQRLFVSYLLCRIGFTESSLMNKYFDKLSSAFKSDPIADLLKEIEIKSKAENIKDIIYNSQAFISATDLSSFDFCPISYSISKSFKIEEPTNEIRITTGIDFHENLRLIPKLKVEEIQEYNFTTNDVQMNEYIKKIKNCELIFSGHTSEEKKFFINKTKKYVGQPDYIFKDESGKYFAVEEKFKYQSNYIPNYNFEQIEESREKVRNTFFTNNIVQLQSYIDYIEDFNIEYGILIYWFYDFNVDFPIVHSVSLKTIQKYEKNYLLEKTLENVKNLKENKTLDLETPINLNKCGSCSVNKYCGHKTGNIKKYSIPYNRRDAYLKYVSFPEELKKEKKDYNNENIDNNDGSEV